MYVLAFWQVMLINEYDDDGDDDHDENDEVSRQPWRQRCWRPAYDWGSVSGATNQGLKPNQI